MCFLPSNLVFQERKIAKRLISKRGVFSAEGSRGVVSQDQETESFLKKTRLFSDSRANDQLQDSIHQKIVNSPQIRKRINCRSHDRNFAGESPNIPNKSNAGGFSDENSKFFQTFNSKNAFVDCSEDMFTIPQNRRIPFSVDISSFKGLRTTASTNLSANNDAVRESTTRLLSPSNGKSKFGNKAKMFVKRKSKTSEDCTYKLEPNENSKNTYKLEIEQLQKLNKQLIDKNIELEERLQRETEYTRINNMLMNHVKSLKKPKIEEKLQNLESIFKSNLLFYEQRKTLESTIQSLTEQVEELQETVACMSQQLYDINELRNDHGIKLVQIIDKANMKYKDVKRECKLNAKKVEKYQEKFNEVMSSNSQLLKIKKEYEETIKSLETQASDLQKEHTFIKKKVLPKGNEDDLAMYNPFELHQRMRYFQNMYEISHSEQLKVQNKLDEVVGYLKIAGLSIESLKTGIATGGVYLNVNKCNTSSFEMKAKEVEVHHNNSTFKKRKITQGSSDIKEKKIKKEISLTDKLNQTCFKNIIEKEDKSYREDYEKSISSSFIIKNLDL